MSVPANPVPANLAVSVPSSADRPWNGETFYEVKKYSDGNVGISLLPMLGDSMTFPNHEIILLSASSIKLWNILEKMLQSLQINHSPDQIFEIGLRAADAGNRDDQEQTAYSCGIENSGHPNTFHTCPACIELKAHHDLEDALGYDLRICSTCREQHRLQAPLDLPERLKPLYKRLKAALQNGNVEYLEASVNDKKALLADIWHDILKDFRQQDGSLVDLYADQILDVDTVGKLCWDGTRHNPMLPSIEAILPVVVNSSGLTSYHYKDNIGITSDALSRAKSGNPPITLHAIMLILRGRENKDFDICTTGITLLSMILNNYCGSDGLMFARHQLKLGRPAPPNIDEIIRSFIEPVLLPRDRTKSGQSDKLMYRFLIHRPLTSAALRYGFTHEHHDFYYSQLHKIAQHILGDSYEAKGLRKLIYRKDRLGKEVFFPLSTTFSVVDNWTNYDLFE